MEILNFVDVHKHDTVRLPTSLEDKVGKSFEIINRSELGVYELYKIDDLQRRSQELQAAIAKRKGGKPTKAQERDLHDVLAEFVQLLIPSAPAKVIELLPRPVREQIIIAWLSRFIDGPGGGRGEAPSRRTTAARSRGSRRSSAATRKHGSTSRGGR